MIYIYWNINRIKSYDRLFNFVVGGRGIGKTYSCKREGIATYLKNGKQFIYLRRYKEELKPLKNNKFFEAISQEFPEWEFKTQGENLMIREATDDDVPEKEKPKFKICGYLINLSTALTKKSVDYSRVGMIIYDEFIIPKGFIHYLPNEVESFLDFYETVARMRDDVKVFFLSNSISSFNPYFVYFKIPPIAQGKFYKTQSLVVEMCDMEEFRQKKKETKFGKLIEGTKYASYAIDNEFYQDNNKFIEKKTKNSRYYCTLIYRDKMIGVWVDYKEGRWYCSNHVDKSCRLTYALTDSDHNINTLYTRVTKPAQLKAISKAYGYGCVFFETQEIKGYMQEVLELIR